MQLVWISILWYHLWQLHYDNIRDTHKAGEDLFVLYFRTTEIIHLELQICHSPPPSALDGSYRCAHKMYSCSCTGVCISGRWTKRWRECALRGCVAARYSRRSQTCCRGCTDTRRRTPLSLTPSRSPQSLKRKTQQHFTSCETPLTKGLGRQICCSPSPSALRAWCRCALWTSSCSYTAEGASINDVLT